MGVYFRHRFYFGITFPEEKVHLAEWTTEVVAKKGRYTERDEPEPTMGTLPETTGLCLNKGCDCIYRYGLVWWNSADTMW